MLLHQTSFQVNPKKGNLYLVATPIGNLNDVTQRALNVLQNSDFIFCENTLFSQRILKKFNIKKELKSYSKNNELIGTQKIINYLNKGLSVSLISSAGLPVISDPGTLLVLTALENKLNVIPIGCNNAALSCFIASGLRAKHFLFLGFLSKKPPQQISLLQQYDQNKNLVILIYESPLRVISTLENISKIYPHAEICIAKELTKLHEQFFRGNIKTVFPYLKKHLVLKGEFTIALKLNSPLSWNKKNNNKIIKKVNELVKKDISLNQALKLTANYFNVKRNFVFDIFYNKKER